MHLEISKGKLKDGLFHGKVTGGTGRLGNITINIDRKLFAEIKPEFGETYSVNIKNGDQVVFEGTMPYARSFGSVAVGENLLFINSSGELSIAINQGSFAKKFNIGSGTNWKIHIKKQ